MDTDDECRDIIKDSSGINDKLQKQGIGYKRENIIKAYLTFYNLSQFIGYTYILSVMAIRYAKLGYASVTSTYEHVGRPMKFLQLMQVMDILHPLFGYTKGGAFMPLFQIHGRLVVLFENLEAEPRLQNSSAVFYLFIVWSLIESVRCAYYITEIYKMKIGFIKWLRYSLWIPLYPCGITCESILILQNIQYFEDTKKWAITLPNSWNLTFNMSDYLKGYVLSLLWAGMVLMKYMYKQRAHQLRQKVVLNKCE